MNKAQAKVKYHGTEYRKYVDKYQDVDEYQWLNTDDIDLHPIRTKLPECPDWHLITNFGQELEDQVFVREKIPFKLDYLIKKTRADVRKDKKLDTMSSKYRAFYNQVWDVLEGDRNYSDVLTWIAEQWYYRLYGKWYFINGKPTYICGWHWFYLNYWHIENFGLPEYRDRDRRWYWAMWYFYNDTTVPIKENGKLVYNDDGSLKLEDVGYRTVDGVNGLKGRRMGDTTKADEAEFCVVSAMREGKGGIQGDSGETGQKAFLEKLMFSYNKLHFIWKPAQTQLNPRSELLFDSDDVDFGLQSLIDYATTAGKSHYDGRKLHFYHGDEVGKVKDHSIHERHSVVRRCLKIGSKTVGFAIYTTTVDDMGLKSGMEFEKLSNSSHYEKRSDSGFTQSGMVNLFFPAYDGFEGFIGKYGESIIDTPTEQQLPYVATKKRNSDGKYMGAKEYLQTERDALTEVGDFVELAHQKRLYPFTFAECFTPPAQNIFFNMDILETNHIDLKRDNEAAIQGNFEWVDGQDSWVDFFPSSNGKWFVSKVLDKSQANKKFINRGVYFPANADVFVSSSDAFRLEKTQGGMSDGGGVVRWKRDPKIDADNKDISTWESCRSVAVYRYRPASIEEYCEDMLKQDIYYGSMQYPENNVNHVADHYRRRGYDGYLLHDTDPKTGRLKPNAGYHSGGAMKQKLFNLVAADIQKHGLRNRHIQITEECMKIKGLDDMTNYDLFTAYGGTLLAEESQHFQYLQQMQHGDTYDIEGFFY
jgi:hypothetical protein